MCRISRELQHLFTLRTCCSTHHRGLVRFRISDRKFVNHTTEMILLSMILIVKWQFLKTQSQWPMSWVWKMMMKLKKVDMCHIFIWKIHCNIIDGDNYWIKSRKDWNQRQRLIQFELYEVSDQQRHLLRHLNTKYCRTRWSCWSTGWAAPASRTRWWPSCWRMRSTRTSTRWADNTEN